MEPIPTSRVCEFWLRANGSKKGEERKTNPSLFQLKAPYGCRAFPC